MTPFPILASSLWASASLVDKLERAPEQHAVAICIGITVAAMVVITAMALVGKVLRARARRARDAFCRETYRKWHKMISMAGAIEPVPSSLVLSKGEDCYRVEEGVTLYEIRSVRHTTHSFGSMSLGEGMHVGQGESTSVSTDEWNPVSSGELYITNRRIYFDGDKLDRKISLDKISTIKAGWSSVEISADGNAKSMVFAGLNGRICEEIVRCLLEQG